MILVYVLCILPDMSAQQKCRIWNESVTIPTYQVGDPDPNPRFYDGRVTQGAQGRVYPYAMTDVLTREKRDQEYEIVYLENDYVQISVIPELGGRIFTAVDKSNNYDFFYRQHVIKPALIGTLGKWISGGSEWNFPHHHKATTMMRMDYLMEENGDGSVTLWLAETERRHRLRITLSLTLHPDRSYLEMGVNPYNPTPYVHSFLYFANPAVHVDSSYQVIFPPNVQYVTQHAKKEFIQWPVASGRYGGKYYRDVDISWWKNLSSPVSFFAWNDEQDFFAGYDHGKQAGVAYVANHHLAPGMKFFTFGSGKAGQAWDKRLTDNDGPYLELMAGVFSDNQPDYSWAQPYENKKAYQYWYPVREIANMHYADLEGALNLDIDHFPFVKIELNSTRELRSARARIEAGEDLLWEDLLDVSPGNPYRADFAVPEDTDPYSICFTLTDMDSVVIMEYSPEKRVPLAMPAPVTPPESPEEFASVEELFLAGLRLDQFYNAQVSPMPFYEEALRRDPGNYDVNTQLGILACKGFRWTEAEQFLRKALERITHNYTRPKDGEAWYYLGVCLKAQGKAKEARDAFYRAGWSQAWHAAAFYQLSEMEASEGNYKEALSHVQESLRSNASNTRALNLMTVLLRKNGMEEDARWLAGFRLDEDPMDLVSRNEAGKKESLRTITRNDPETLLEMASWYGGWGCPGDAIEILSWIDGSTHPMVYYYRGWYSEQIGDSLKAEGYYRLAASMPTDYCFPYRYESLALLEHLAGRYPEDEKALYYLGNLLYESQPGRAMDLWKKAEALGSQNPVLYRNLGLAYHKVDEDYGTAIAYYKKALELKKDPRIVYELDMLYEQAGAELDIRQALFDENREVVPGRVDALIREVLVYIQAQRYDEAIDLLENNYFYRWEGGEEVRQYYEDAYYLRGLDRFRQGKCELALADFQAALVYPENLEEGRPEFNESFARSYYYLGLAHEECGKKKIAKQYFRKAAEEDAGNSEYLYYNYLASVELKERDAAAARLKELRAFADRGPSGRFFAKFGEQSSERMKEAEKNYRQGLALICEGDEGAAAAAFRKCLELNPYHNWARAMLEGI